jgi:import inner membrane translocase subunit TIM23
MSQTITWTRFFQLRRAQKTTEQVLMVCLGVGGLMGGSYYFGAVADFDPIQPVFGVMDPHIAYGGASLLVGAVAAATGSIGGSHVWRLAQSKSLLKALDAREKEFFQRIQRHRPKEIKTSLQNPLPDYYGENIRSVGDYRRWIKKQRQWRVKVGVAE